MLFDFPPRLPDDFENRVKQKIEDGYDDFGHQFLKVKGIVEKVHSDRVKKLKEAGVQSDSKASISETLQLESDCSDFLLVGVGVTEHGKYGVFEGASVKLDPFLETQLMKSNKIRRVYWYITDGDKKAHAVEDRVAAIFFSAFFNDSIHRRIFSLKALSDLLSEKFSHKHKFQQLTTFNQTYDDLVNRQKKTANNDLRELEATLNPNSQMTPTRFTEIANMSDLLNELRGDSKDKDTVIDAFNHNHKLVNREREEAEIFKKAVKENRDRLVGILSCDDLSSGTPLAKKIEALKNNKNDPFSQYLLSLVYKSVEYGLCRNFMISKFDLIINCPFAAVELGIIVRISSDIDYAEHLFTSTNLYEAKICLADMHSYPDLPAYDEAKIIQNYKLAAEMGSTYGLARYAACLLLGIGCTKAPKNTALALKYLSIAAEKEEPEAFVQLGDYFYTHNNNDKALQCYNKAFSLNCYAPAAFRLAGLNPKREEDLTRSIVINAGPSVGVDLCYSRMSPLRQFTYTNFDAKLFSDLLEFTYEGDRYQSLELAQDPNELDAEWYIRETPFCSLLKLKNHLEIFKRASAQNTLDKKDIATVGFVVDHILADQSPQTDVLYETIILLEEERDFLVGHSYDLYFDCKTKKPLKIKNLTIDELIYCCCQYMEEECSPLKGANYIGAKYLYVTKLKQDIENGSYTPKTRKTTIQASSPAEPLESYQSPYAQALAPPAPSGMSGRELSESTMWAGGNTSPSSAASPEHSYEHGQQSISSPQGYRYQDSSSWDEGLSTSRPVSNHEKQYDDPESSYESSQQSASSYQRPRRLDSYARDKNTPQYVSTHRRNATYRPSNPTSSRNMESSTSLHRSQRQLDADNPYNVDEEPIRFLSTDPRSPNYVPPTPMNNSNWGSSSMATSAASTHALVRQTSRFDAPQDSRYSYSSTALVPFNPAALSHNSMNQSFLSLSSFGSTAATNEFGDVIEKFKACRTLVRSPEARAQVAQFDEIMKNLSKENIKEKLPALMNLSKEGCPEARVALGNICQHGRYGSRVDLEKAKWYYIQAGNSPEALLALAEAYALAGNEKNPNYYASMVDYYRLAAENGSSVALARLGALAFLGLGCQKNRAHGLCLIGLITSKSDDGDKKGLAEAFIQKGDCFFGKDVEEDPQTGTTVVKKSPLGKNMDMARGLYKKALLADPNCTFRVQHRLIMCDVVEGKASLESVLGEISKIANDADAETLLNLAFWDALVIGGCPNDIIQTYILKAAKTHKSIPACIAVAKMLRDGSFGLRHPDTELAIKFFGFAAKKCDQACFDLGCLLITANLNPAKGRKIIEELANKGHIEALEMVIKGYKDGTDGWEVNRTMKKQFKKKLEAIKKEHGRDELDLAVSQVSNIGLSDFAASILRD